MLKSDKDVKRIKTGDTEYKVSQFADDMTILLDGSETVFKTMSILSEFANISGLKIIKQTLEQYGLVVKSSAVRLSIIDIN